MTICLSHRSWWCSKGFKQGAIEEKDSDSLNSLLTTKRQVNKSKTLPVKRQKVVSEIIRHYFLLWLNFIVTMLLYLPAAGSSGFFLVVPDSSQVHHQG